MTDRWPGNTAANTLFRYVRVKPRDLWWGETAALLAGAAAAGGWLGAVAAGQVKDVIAVAAALVGEVIGAVVAAMAIQATGFTPSLLRNLAEKELDPAHYLTPFLTTAVVGVFALLALLGWAGVPRDVHPVLLGALGGLSGGLTLSALVSLVPALGALIQFIGVQQLNAGIPDDPAPGPSPTPRAKPN